MKRSILAAGVGLCIFATTMVLSNHSVKAQEYNGNVMSSDTTPRKDTTKKKPDTLHLNLSAATANQLK